MSKTKTFFGRLIADVVSGLGNIFKHVIDGAKETFKHLDQDTKDALIHGSGILDLINRLSGQSVADVRAAIKEQFPDVDEAKLEEGLFKIAHTFNLAPKVNDLDDVISSLQTYLSTLEGQSWEVIMHSAASILGIFLAPKETKVGGVVSLIEYIYQTFFAKK